MPPARRRPGPPTEIDAPADVERNRAAAIDAFPAGIAGGRVSKDSLNTVAPRYFVPPQSPEDDWRILSLDAMTFEKMSPVEVMRLLVDLSPDCSRALWDFLRMGNPGWEVYAYRPGTEEEDENATILLHQFLDHLERLYGTVDVVINRILIGGWLRGAYFAELVLSKRTPRRPVDIATPDPVTARFDTVDDPDRGTVFRLGQWQDGKWTPLDTITVKYIPVDPLNGTPYGRPIVSPAIFSAVFLLSMLHDIRRVIQQQGYSRIDISIDLGKLRESMPLQLKSSTAAWEAWVKKAVSDVEGVIRQLQPDDTYVHTDVTTVNRAPGAVDSSSLGAVDGIIRALERFLTRALKTMPLLMGTAEGASEANANRQWEIHAAGIKAMQHPVETLLETFFQLALRAQGVQADVEFCFGELRTSEMLRDQQVEALVILNALQKYMFGYISQEEAGLEVTGHDPERDFPIAIPGGYTPFTDPDAEPEPVPAALQDPNLPAQDPNQPADDAMDQQPDPGANRKQPVQIGEWRKRWPRAYGGPRTRRTRRAPLRFRPPPARRGLVGLDQPLPIVPGEVDISIQDREKAAALFDTVFPEYAGILRAAVVE